MEIDQQITTSPTNNNYVVMRNGYRVSDKSYQLLTDPELISELKFWKNVSKNHSKGDKIEAVKLT